LLSNGSCYWWCFGKIVGSAVDDVIMPIVGLLTGGIDFTKSSYGNGLYWFMAKRLAAVITYGNLVQAIINFVIIAFFFCGATSCWKAKKKEVVVVAAPAGPTQKSY
jgi:large conductance mechanosensitive channel